MFDWISKRRASPLAKALRTEFPMVPAGQGGFLAGTHVASNLGWRQVEALSIGDKVLTFDHGMQPIVKMYRETILVPEGDLKPAQTPMYIPQDVLNNRVPMWVMPDQGLLLESDLAVDELGDPFVVVPACALEGYRGIRRMTPGMRMELIVPHFEQDEVIYLEAGLLGYSPARPCIIEGAAFGTSLYRVLSHADARALVVDMMAEEAFWAPDLPSGPGGQGEAQFATIC